MAANEDAEEMMMEDDGGVEKMIHREMITVAVADDMVMALMMESGIPKADSIALIYYSVTATLCQH